MYQEKEYLLRKIVNSEDFEPYNKLEELKELHRAGYIEAKIENDGSRGNTFVTDVSETKIRDLDQYGLDRDLIKPEPKGDEYILKLGRENEKNTFSIIQNLNITGISVAFESLIGPFKEFFKRLKKSLNSG